MAYYDIHKALTQSLIDLALEVPLAHEDRNFNPDANISYTTDTAGYNIGDTAITLITGTGEIYDGGNVSFAGDPNYYPVVTGISAPGVVTIAAPGLIVAIAASAVATTAHIEQFIDITTLPAVTEVLSKDSIDIEFGIYQLSIYTRSGIGVKKAYEMADTLQAFYRHGVTLTVNGQIVFIEVMSRGPGRNNNGWFIIDLSIEYKADLLR
jgi:hypothetical protein